MDSEVSTPPLHSSAGLTLCGWVSMYFVYVRPLKFSYVQSTILKHRYEAGRGEWQHSIVGMLVRKRLFAVACHLATRSSMLGTTAAYKCALVTKCPRGKVHE